MSDHKGARLVLHALPPAKTLIADRGYDSRWFREALRERGIEPCIPSSKSRKLPFPYDKLLYRQRHRVENLFAKLKDWRRIATRYDRCPHTIARQEDAGIRDLRHAAEQVLRFIEKAIVSASGKKIPGKIPTFCVHGDEPTAVPVMQGRPAST